MEVKKVTENFIYSCLYVGVIVFGAYIFAELLKCCSCFCDTDKISKISKILGLLIIGSAVLGRMGWEIQTWKAGSPAEKRNKQLFRWFYYIGIFFTAFSVFIQN